MIYARIAAYVLGVAACVAFGWHMGGLGPKAQLSDLKATYALASAKATQEADTQLKSQIATNAGIAKQKAESDAKIEVLADRLKSTAGTVSVRIPACPSRPAVQQGGGGQQPESTTGDGGRSISFNAGPYYDFAERAAKLREQFLACQAKLNSTE